MGIWPAKRVLTRFGPTALIMAAIADTGISVGATLAVAVRFPGDHDRAGASPVTDHPDADRLAPIAGDAAWYGHEDRWSGAAFLLAVRCVTDTELRPCPLDDGRYHSGDLAGARKDGPQITGRISDVINNAGRKPARARLQHVRRSANDHGNRTTR